MNTEARFDFDSISYFHSSTRCILHSPSHPFYLPIQSKLQTKRCNAKFPTNHPDVQCPAKLPMRENAESDLCSGECDPVYGTSTVFNVRNEKNAKCVTRARSVVWDG